MNRTDTLLRLKRFRVDEMKRRIAAIDAMKGDLERKLTDLDDNVARERQRAGDSDIGRLAFPSFLRSIEVARENLRNTLKEIEREICRASRSCRMPSRTSNRWKSPPSKQTKRLSEMQARRAQARLDEIRAGRHLRKARSSAALNPARLAFGS
jgi:flagellar biosynthesis chaperone FliJ